MVVAAKAKLFTPEDLLRDPELKNFELINGQLVEKDVSLLSSYTAGRVFKHADNHVEPRRLGWCFPDNTSIQCYAEDPSRVRKPDFLFVKAGRLTQEDFNEGGHLRIVPDAVAEVVSPNDNAYDVRLKVEEYLRAGVRLVWVIWPTGKFVDVYRKNGEADKIIGDQDLDGEDVIPGFKMTLGDLFATE